MLITYTPTVSLVPGSTGVIEVDLAEDGPPTRKMEGAQHSANDGGTVETVLFRNERQISIKAGPVPRSDRDIWREFEDSVANGAEFTIDLYGTQAVPDNPVTTRMVFNSFSEQKEGPLLRYYSFRIFD